MLNNENGRSMVEMLGVLAIIGVLSVAGIAGYTMAMRKYRANEIVNAASQVAILARAAGAGTGGTVKYTDTMAAGTIPSGVTEITGACSGDTCTVEFTGLTDTNLKTAVCNAISGNNFYTVAACS